VPQVPGRGRGTREESVRTGRSSAASDTASVTGLGTATAFASGSALSVPTHARIEWAGCGTPRWTYAAPALDAHLRDVPVWPDSTTHTHSEGAGRGGPLQREKAVAPEGILIVGAEEGPLDGGAGQLRALARVLARMRK
jgi:hypothetical protein